MKTKIHQTLAVLLWLAPLSTLAAERSAPPSSRPSTSETTGEFIDDAAITTKIKAMFAKDNIVKAIDVKVTTMNGVVQLSGNVTTTEQKDRAELIARRVDGVKSVQNKINVR